ncbi:MAG TPA: phosphatase PAP2 family protein [Pseudolabrys sp.]|nr:phosphatase PAP2 family protein [Pseudolabrys sp.]
MSGIDSFLIRIINQVSGHSPVFDHFVALFVDMTSIKMVPLMAALWGVWFSGGGPKHSKHPVIVALVGAFVALVIARLMQDFLPFRPRPLFSPDLHVVFPPSGSATAKLTHANSLPSDHAALAFALSCGLFFRSRLLGWLAIAWSTVFVCLPRVYVGFHYPSDIAAGAVLGLVCTWVASNLAATGSLTKLILRAEERWPGVFYFLAFGISFEIANLFYDVRTTAEQVLLAVQGY